jgi:hypothetical protein
MKPLYKLLILLVLPAITFANNGKFKGKYTKEKTIKKEYTVNSNAGLEINNRYGDINVTTWNENKTVIEVIIRTNGNNEERVQERLDEISIDLDGNATKVSATTELKSDSNWGWNSNNKKKNVSMEIMYNIKIPKTNTVDLNNKYGAITLGDLDGNAKINNKYGQITLGILSAENNQITIKYVKTATIKFMRSGKINAGYSTFTLDASDDLELEASYTATNLGTIGDLNYNNRYGKLRVSNVTNVIGNAAYNSGKFGSITGNANFNVRYSPISIETLTASAKDVTFNGRYSKFSAGVASNYAFDIEASLKYASLGGKDLFTLSTQESKSNSKFYKGYHTSKNSGNKMNINSSYGSITIK